MQNKQYNYCVFIGRFQPVHMGHLRVVQEALDKAEKVIILIGSANQPPSTRNPFSYAERVEMILANFSQQESERIFCSPLVDVVYNDDLWVKNVQSTVNGIIAANDLHINPPTVALIGHSKDKSSFYLNLFPQWKSIDVENYLGLDATRVRNRFFANYNHENVHMHLDELVKDQVLSKPTANYLKEYGRSHSNYRKVSNEMEFIKVYKDAWKAAPYPPTFVTVDAVVVQSGHVLMVKRKAEPGSGLLALPGGFVNQDERIIDACLRELKEETQIDVPVKVLRGSIELEKVYDDPNRSARGRTITHAFLIKPERRSKLPKVKGGDDAEQAMWIPIAELDPLTIFEDHFHIIMDLISSSEKRG